MKSLTITEAALELGLARSTLLKQVDNGRLAVTRVGPIFVIEKAEVERYRRESLGQRGRKRHA